MPGSQTPIADDIETCSNVGIPGLFVYRVDQYDIIQPNYVNNRAGKLNLMNYDNIISQYVVLFCFRNINIQVSINIDWRKNNFDLLFKWQYQCKLQLQMVTQ